MKSKGRGAAFNPPNRFEKHHLEPFELDYQPDDDGDERKVPTMFYKDTSKTILATNDSPDVPFTYSLNPYRGCEHGCIYCYARPSHEYLGFSAGIDFESKIVVKYDAPELLGQTLRRKNWKPQAITISGNTDPYQPVERKLQLTRRCLEVLLKFCNPVSIITKNHLVTRDIDILRELAKLNLILVHISVSCLDETIVRRMEPRTSTPAKRFEAMEMLAANGIPVAVNASPIIPGLSDKDLPTILKSAASHGAKFAGYSLVRLPGAVEQIFSEWVHQELPNRSEKILNRIGETHAGRLNDSRWTKRMTGEGEFAGTTHQLFETSCKKYGLNKKEFELPTAHFRREPDGQMEMFG
jgi:DNA repair photolyase